MKITIWLEDRAFVNEQCGRNQLMMVLLVLSQLYCVLSITRKNMSRPSGFVVKCYDI